MSRTVFDEARAALAPYPFIIRFINATEKSFNWSIAHGELIGIGLAPVTVPRSKRAALSILPSTVNRDPFLLLIKCKNIEDFDPIGMVRKLIEDYGDGKIERLAPEEFQSLKYAFAAGAALLIGFCSEQAEQLRADMR